MQSNFLGAMRACLITLSVPLAVLASISNAQANITFQFEGELTHGDNPLSGTFSSGDKFAGTYTFDETSIDPSFDRDTQFALFQNSISAMSFATENEKYKVSATNGDISQDFQNGLGYSVAISPLSGNSINNFALDTMFLAWTVTSPGSGDGGIPITDPGYDPNTPPWVGNPEDDSDYFDADGNLVYRGDVDSPDSGLVGNPDQPLFNEDGNPVPIDGNFTLRFSDGQSFVDIQGDLSSVTVVPIPTAIWLFGSGLLGLAGIAKRKQVL